MSTRTLQLLSKGLLFERLTLSNSFINYGTYLLIGALITSFYSYQYGEPSMPGSPMGAKIFFWASPDRSVDDSVALDKAWWEESRALINIKEEMGYMPKTMKNAAEQFLTDLEENFPALTDHQKKLLNTEEIFGGKVISKKRNPQRFEKINQIFREQIEYVRDRREQEWEYAFFVNAAPHWNGGQKGYLMNLKNGVILEVVVSTGWKGIGYGMDSEKTPLGYFVANDEQNIVGWENKTILGQPTDLFRRLQFQRWWDYPQWLHRVNTLLEKAYITSNQIALKGMNDGSEELPLNAATHYPELHPFTNVDNMNTAMRHIYIHGTNRNDQLGRALSGGCVRVSNSFSFMLSNIYKSQGYEMPVFIDAIKMYEGTPPLLPEVPDDDFRIIEMNSPYASAAVSLKESYKSIGQYDFIKDSTLKLMKTKIDLMIVQPVAQKLLNDPEKKITLNISSSIPMPEAALGDWLSYRYEMEGYGQSSYKHRFDLHGNYYQSREVKDPGCEGKPECTTDQVHPSTAD